MKKKKHVFFFNLYDSSAKLTFKSLKNHERWKEEDFSVGEGWYFQLRNLNPERFIKKSARKFWSEALPPQPRPGVARS